jgi:hypothetical protein
MSDTDLGILQTRGTPNLLEELARGNPAQTSMIQTNRARIDNMRTSAKLRKKELFVDMLIHIMVHSHYHGKCPLEWIMKISSILKAGGLSNHASDNMCRIALSYSGCGCDPGNSTLVTTQVLR